MLLNEKEFSPQESLKLITEMIEKTKDSISDRSHYFLLWGWAVVAGCLIQYYLKAILHFPQHYYAWLVTPVALALHFIFIYRDRRRERAKTYINEAMAYLWTSIGVSFFVLGFVFAEIGWRYCYPFYILLYAIGTYISGNLIKFTPMVAGGLLCFALVIICVYLPYDLQILVTAFAILISYIIPGFMLRSKYKKQQKIFMSRSI